MREFVSCCVLSSLAIPLSVSMFAGSLPNYGGLSGIDSALFVLFVLLWMKERRAEGELLSMGIGVCLLFAFVGKSIYETLSGGALFAELGGGMVSVPVAHFTGGIVGWMCTIEKKSNWWHHPMASNPVMVRETK